MAAGIDVMRLPVSAGFHTPSVAFARAPWQAALAGMTPAVPGFRSMRTPPPRPIGRPGRPSCRPWPSSRSRPCASADQVEAAYAVGGRVFLEIGPKAVLTRWSAKSWPARPHVAIATNPDPSTDAACNCIGRSRS
ncbi:MAG: hypothetical protein WDN49_18690 [Acetobacteraceae bacterium]